MRLISFDVETDGTEEAYALQPFRVRSSHAWLTSYATAAFKGEDLVVSGGLNPSVDTLQHLLMTCAAKKVRIVGWNTPFDVAWLIALGLREEVFACQWLDAMLLKKHLTARPVYDTKIKTVYGLKPTVEEVYGAEARYNDDVDFRDESPEARAKLLTYNKGDAAYTLRLAHKYLDEMTPRQRRAALIEAACIPAIAETMVEGIAADGAACAALGERLQDDANLAYVTLKLEAGDGAVTPEVLASPKQLADLLYEQWRLPVPKLTDKGASSTDKEALTTLAAKDPRAKQVRDYREARNNKTKFVDATVEALEHNGDGCVRPQPRIASTYTGRMTYSSTQGRGKAEVQTGIPIHQMKKDKAFRNTIVPPEGYTLVEHDFAGQEYKWMAVESNDMRMLELCQPGEDPHSFMGARVASWEYRKLMAGVAEGDDEAKKLRQMGKVGNLSLQYRTSANTLERVALVQYGLPLTPGEAKALHATYRTTYPGVKTYWRRQIDLAKLNGWVETQAGRRVQLGTYDTWDHDSDWSYESTAINFPIQGVGADQKYLALMVLRDYLPAVDGRLYFELHDGIFTVVPDRYAEKAAVEIKQLLSALPYEKAWGRSFPIQFPVDAKLGKAWGDLKEVHA